MRNTKMNPRPIQNDSHEYKFIPGEECFGKMRVPMNGIMDIANPARAPKIVWIQPAIVRDPLIWLNGNKAEIAPSPTP
jgi:hypothetical protein